MADDGPKRDPRDRTRIAIHEEHEVRYWTKRFGVSASELGEAVKMVGSSPSAVQRHLSSRSRSGGRLKN